MDNIGTFLLRITASALLCGIVRSLPVTGIAAKLMKLLTGVFMLVTLILPLKDIFLPQFGGNLNALKYDAQQIIGSAQTQTRQELQEIIISETEAYILDKAKNLGAELTVEVSVDDSDLPMPCAVTVRGSISPYAKQQLQQIICSDLGIDTEDQKWIG